MPTRHLVSLAAVLIAVSYAAISQGNGPAYLPAYALCSMLLVSWIHNRNSVKNLEITTNRQVYGFAGAVVLVPFRLQNTKKNQARIGLRITTGIGGKAQIGRAEGLVEGTVSVPGLKRGIYPVGTFSISSIFPLGVFESVHRQKVDCECFVYPEAVGEREIPHGGSGQVEKKTGVRISGDDFAGVRNYKLGESQRHIDWKAVARGQPLMVKQFETIAQDEFWLDAETLRGLDLEIQLSQLARWVMRSERAGTRYGLRIGSFVVPPGSGNAHFHQCLRLLAAHPSA